MSFTIYQNNEKQIEVITRPKMVVTKLESNNLPILEKNYYEYLIECFKKQYGII